VKDPAPREFRSRRPSIYVDGRRVAALVYKRRMHTSERVRVALAPAGGHRARLIFFPPQVKGLTNLLTASLTASTYGRVRPQRRELKSAAGFAVAKRSPVTQPPEQTVEGRLGSAELCSSNVARSRHGQ